MKPTCRWCRLLGFSISALVHMGVGAAVLWYYGDRAVDVVEEYPVAVSLAMFEPEPVPVESDPVVAAAPTVLPEPEPNPEPVSEPEPELEKQTESEPETEPELKPVPERDLPPKSEPKPKPKPKSKLEPKPKPVSKAPEPPSKTRESRPPAKAAAVRPSGKGSPPPGTTQVVTQSTKALEAAYLRELRQSIAKQRRYPKKARRRGETGTVTLSFVIDRNGGISGIQVAGKSGSSTLDKAGVDTLRRLKRFKPIPEALGRNRWALRVPIRFSLE